MNDPQFTDGGSSVPALILTAVAWVLLWLAPVGTVLYLGYYFISLPLRRQERARFFLDLVETGMKDGRSMEQTVVAVSAAGDSSMGMRFHLLAGYLEGGHSFEQALHMVPRFLPGNLTAMLTAGIHAGDVSKVLPACRHLLKDALSQTRGALNYLVLLAFAITPATILTFATFQIVVLPKCLDIFEGMTEGQSPPGALTFIQHHSLLMLLAQASLLFFVWFVAFLYVGGPRLHAGIDFLLGPLADWLLYLLPWRRKRMQRDFSAALAILLDAGLPEKDALGVAAQCANNRLFLKRSAKAEAALQSGAKLTDAVALIDGTGEFQWRLAHAIGAQTPSGFQQAIAGWNESLDARAFQQEQATAQMVTTGLILLNGLFVGTVVIGVFSMLIGITNAGLLW